VAGGGRALGIVLVLAEGLPHAHPEQLYPIASSAFAPAEIARRGLPVTDADEYQPIAVTRLPTGDLPCGWWPCAVR